MSFFLKSPWHGRKKIRGLILGIYLDMRLNLVRALGAVLLVVTACCTTFGATDQRVSQPAYREALKTVKVAQQSPTGPGYWCGSAFLIYVTEDSKGRTVGHFLTAKHVVDLKTETTVLFRRPGDPKKYYARVRLDTIKMHPVWDAAVFEVTGLPPFFAKPLPLASGVVPDEWVLSAGFANCGNLSMFYGHARGLHMLDGFGPCIMSDAKILVGMSGGPVLNKKGEVLGHTVAKGNDNEHFFIPVSLLRVWLATL